jgi:cell pole-organizing protein PopZ
MEHLLASIRKAIDSDIGGLQGQAGSSATASQFKGTMNQLRVRYDSPASPPGAADEISELRNKISRSRSAEGADGPLGVKRPLPSGHLKPGFAEILGGNKVPKRMAPQPLAPAPLPAAEPPRFRPTYQDDDAPMEPPVSYAEPDSYPNEAWPETAPSYLPVPARDSGYREAPYYEEQGQAPLMSDRAASMAHASFSQLADTLMARAMGERSIEEMTQDLLKGMLRNWLDVNLPAIVERLVREEIERVARRGR